MLNLLEEIKQLDIEFSEKATVERYVKDLYSIFGDNVTVEQKSFVQDQEQQCKEYLVYVLERKKREIELENKQNKIKYKKLSDISSQIHNVIPYHIFYDKFDLGSCDYYFENIIRKINVFSIDKKVTEIESDLYSICLNGDERKLEIIMGKLENLSNDGKELRKQIYEELEVCKELIDQSIRTFVISNTELINFRIESEIIRPISNQCERKLCNPINAAQFKVSKKRSINLENISFEKYPLELLNKEKNNVTVESLKDRIRRRSYEIICEIIHVNFNEQYYDAIDCEMRNLQGAIEHNCDVIKNITKIIGRMTNEN